MLFPALLVVLLAFVLRPEGSMEHPLRDCHRQLSPQRAKARADYRCNEDPIRCNRMVARVSEGLRSTIGGLPSIGSQ
jgi:hypothetical protein